MLRYLKTVRCEINALVIASALLLAIKIFWLNTIPQLFDGGAALGEIVDRLCASILSSYVFFLIVVHLKSEKDKETINPYVSSRVQRIVGDCVAQLSALQTKSGVMLNLEKLTKEDIEAALKQIDPKSQAPLILGFGGQHANWLQFMDYHRTRTTQIIEKLFRKVTFLDSKMVQHLANIDDCSHFSSIQFQAGAAMLFKNTTLEAWASCFFDYCDLARKLDAYEKSKLSAYRPEL